MNKSIFEMSPDELNRHLTRTITEKFDKNKKNTQTATEYSDLILHRSIADKNPDEKITINGNKHVSTINEDDHLVLLGGILNISEVNDGWVR